MARAIAGGLPGARMIATRTRNPRALDPGALTAAARAAGIEAEEASNVPDACRAALAVSAPAGEVLLTGSLFAVGEAMEAFGGAPGEWQ